MTFIFINVFDCLSFQPKTEEKFKKLLKQPFYPHTKITFFSSIVAKKIKFFVLFTLSFNVVFTQTRTGENNKKPGVFCAGAFFVISHKQKKGQKDLIPRMT